MIITKLEEKLTYIKKTELHTILLDKKQVRVYEHSEESKDATEYDIDIDTDDLRLLSEEETRVLNDNMAEILATTKGNQIEKD